jgi:hypothetical protein
MNAVRLWRRHSSRLIPNYATLFIHLRRVYRHRPVWLSLSQTTATFDGSTATALRLQPQVQLEAYNDMPLLKAIFGEEEDEG